MHNQGNVENKLWVVSSCPKRGDIAGPLSSSVGRGFVNYMVTQGVHIEDIRFDYLVGKVPPPGEIKNGIQYFKKVGVLAEELSLLKARIQTYKPNLVLGLGADVLESLLGQKGVLKWRGHPIWSDELGCKVMITFDPFHAHTQKRVHKDQKPGQYQTLLEADQRRAVQEMKFPQMLQADPHLKIAPSHTECVAELRRMLDEAKIISYDIEVFKPYAGRLMDCIGLCDNTGSAICIPFYLQNPDNKAVRYWRNETEYLEVLTLLKQLMASQIPKVAQNSQFDTTMLEKYYDMPVNNLVWDTMVVQHSLYCDLPKDLGTLISLYTKLPYHKYMINSSSSSDRWLYNAADAVANLHVMQGQIKEMYELEGETCPELPATGEIPDDLFNLEGAKHYYGVPNPTISSCVYMHIAGVKIDMELRDRVIELERGTIAQLNEAINRAIPVRMHKNKKDPRNFNPMSPAQKNILFYDILDCPLQRNQGKVTSDKHALEKFKHDKRHYVVTLAEACLETKAADTRLLKFKVEPDNGYIRTQYDVTGTDTGRLASKESDVMLAGTNLQNIAKGPQRQMFIPEDGEEFALVDLYAAEAYLNALDAGEIDMLKMISGLEETEVWEKCGMRVMSGDTATKYKIHNWMQNITREHWPEECIKGDYTYKDAKQTIHGLNYNVMPDKMAKESGLPLSVTQWQYAMYHHKFPGIKGRMTRINMQLQRSHCLTSPLGRRRFFIQDICPELYNIAYAWPSQSCIGEITEVAQNYLHLMSDMHEAGMDVPFCRPVLNTHDGLAIRIDPTKREEVIQQIIHAFNIPLFINNCTITIPISIGFAPNFNDMSSEDVYFYALKI